MKDQLQETLSLHVPAAYKIIYYIITVDGREDLLKALSQGILSPLVAALGLQTATLVLPAECCDSERS